MAGNNENPSLSRARDVAKTGAKDETISNTKRETETGNSAVLDQAHVDCTPSECYVTDNPINNWLKGW
jgi:hypothetical protein